jgi:hypothetical protein
MPITIDVKNMMARAGGEEAIEFRLRRFEDDVRYLHSLRHELLRKYLNKWVAVHERSLVAHGKSASELRRQLSAKGIPANEAVIDFIASERKAMLL